MSKILAVCLNPTFQRTFQLPVMDAGEVNRAQGERLDASGKGMNVARVLTQLGHEVRQLTHLGPGGDEFVSLCRNDGVEVAWEASDSPVRTCVTLLDAANSRTTEIVGTAQPVDEKTVEAVRRRYSLELEWADRVVISGSKAPGYPENLFAEFCRTAKDLGKPVLADYRGGELEKSLQEKPSVVKTNLVEFVQTFLPGEAVSESRDEEVVPKVEEKMKELSGQGVSFVVTRGAREILWAADGELSRVSPPMIVPVNTIGSGDATAAGLTHALDEGKPFGEAVAFAAQCGAENALQLKPGSLT